MAKSKKYVDLTHAQKDEIRRLTQFANRRIKATQKVYAKEGMDVLPREIVGDLQVKEEWHTKTTPLSRSVKFESMSDYRKQINFLRRFEFSRPDIHEFTEVQRDKTLQAIETSMGMEAPPEMQEKIKKMTAPQLSKFWDTFENKAVRLLGNYSSNSAMSDTVAEVFPEDLQGLATNVNLPRPTATIAYR